MSRITIKLTQTVQLIVGVPDKLYDWKNYGCFTYTIMQNILNKNQSFHW